jgi:hypothetical protein
MARQPVRGGVGAGAVAGNIVYNVPRSPSCRASTCCQVDQQPLRLLLGWFAVISPRCLGLAVRGLLDGGRVLHGSEALAEWRRIADRPRPLTTAARSRTTTRRLVSLFFYAVTAGLFSGVFVVTAWADPGAAAGHPEDRPARDSPVQNPERLWREAAS